LAVLPLRRTLRIREHYADRLFVGSVAICALELLVRTLPGDLSSDTGRTLVTWLLDWSHLVGAAVWVGGLIGLAVTASLLRPSRGAPPHAARTLIRRFSNLAIVCVGALTIILEAALGIAVLAIVPFLSGSARAAAQRQPLTDAIIGSLPVTFTPSAL
jgi:putative copper export protein